MYVLINRMANHDDAYFAGFALFERRAGSRPCVFLEAYSVVSTYRQHQERPARQLLAPGFRYAEQQGGHFICAELRSKNYASLFAILHAAASSVFKYGVLVHTHSTSLFG